MNKYAVLCSIVCVAGLSLLSCGKVDDPIINPNDTNAVNEWIYKTMDQHYLWYDELPAKSSLNFKDKPDDFFEALLSDKDGKQYADGRHLYFSTIEESTKTKGISDTEPTYGFEFAISSVRNTNYYYCAVLYVLPDSPADKAGLKRGDWILSTGENRANITDYKKLLRGDAIVLNLATDDGGSTLKPSGSVSLEAARVMESNPILKDTVLHVSGKTIGYLSYMHFSSGPDDNSNKAYDNQLKDIFAQFKAQQANEFVLDLRYNGGGLVSSAQVLTSLLAPSEALGKVFGYMKYNDKINKESTLYFDKSSAVVSANLNLSRIYVLIGQITASASEAVVNMLIPYVGRENITLIGEQTIGKNVGSTPYGDDKDYGWVLHPITLRIYNKDHNADYDNGFAPDISIDEFDKPLSPLGDPSEYMLATAIQKITGISPLKSTSTATSPVEKPLRYSLDSRGVKGLIIEPNN